MTRWAAKSLEDLLEWIQQADFEDLSNERLLAKLPTFGGDEPDDTAGVFSWDETRLLVQTQSGWAIVGRDERKREAEADTPAVFVGDRRFEANDSLICAFADMVIEELRRKDESEAE